MKKPGKHSTLSPIFRYTCVAGFSHQKPSKSPNCGSGADVSGVTVVVGKVVSGKVTVSVNASANAVVSSKGRAICFAGSDTTDITGAMDSRTGASGNGKTDGSAMGNVQNRTDASKLPVTRFCVFGS